jgi:hypothetical protein
MRAYKTAALVVALIAAVVMVYPRASTTFDLHALTETVTYFPENEQEWELGGVHVHANLADTAGTKVTGRLILQSGVKVVIERVSLGPLFIRFEAADPQQILARFEQQTGTTIPLRATSLVIIPELESRAHEGEGLLLTLRGRLDVGRPPHLSSETKAPILRNGTVDMLGSSFIGGGSFSAGTASLYSGDQFKIGDPESASLGFIAADEGPALTVGYRTIARFATIVRPGGSTPRIGASRFAMVRGDASLQAFLLVLLYLLPWLNKKVRSASMWITTVRAPKRGTAIVSLPGVLVAFSLYSHPLAAQSVYLKGAEEGQGLTRPRGEGECFVVAPHHVMGRNADTTQDNATVAGEGGVKVEANVRERFLRADLVILQFPATSALPCPEWNIPENLGELLLDSSAPASLRIREEDGSIIFIPVWVRSVDPQNVTIVPRMTTDMLTGGMSGSQLIVKGVFAGVLQEVNNGTGSVMRSDYVQRIVSGFFARRPRPQAPMVSAEVTFTLAEGESRIIGDRNSGFGYIRRGERNVTVKLNGVERTIGPGDRLSFPDSRGECFIVVLRWDNPSGIWSGTPQASFRVACNPSGGSGAGALPPPELSEDRASSRPGDLSWTGRYTCTQGVTGMTLTLQRGAGGELHGTASFFAVPENPNVPPGQYTVTATRNGNQLRVEPRAWIVRPVNYHFASMEGTLTQGARIYSGRYVGEGCGSFRLESDGMRD